MSTAPSPHRNESSLNLFYQFFVKLCFKCPLSPYFIAAFIFIGFASSIIPTSAQTLSAGAITGWGNNGENEVSIPSDLSAVAAIAAGGYHTLALKKDGTVVGWGDQTDGVATPPTGLADVIAIAAGVHHSLALKADGTVVVWGNNTYSQTNIPSGLTDVVAIAAGAYHNIVLKRDGSLVAWGGIISMQGRLLFLRD